MALSMDGGIAIDEGTSSGTTISPDEGPDDPILEPGTAGDTVPTIDLGHSGQGAGQRFSGETAAEQPDTPETEGETIVTGDDDSATIHRDMRDIQVETDDQDARSTARKMVEAEQSERAGGKGDSPLTDVWDRMQQEAPTSSSNQPQGAKTKSSDGIPWKIIGGVAALGALAYYA